MMAMPVVLYCMLIMTPYKLCSVLHMIFPTLFKWFLCFFVLFVFVYLRYLVSCLLFVTSQLCIITGTCKIRSKIILGNFGVTEW